MLGLALLACAVGAMVLMKSAAMKTAVRKTKFVKSILKRPATKPQDDDAVEEVRRDDASGEGNFGVDQH